MKDNVAKKRWLIGFMVAFSLSNAGWAMDEPEMSGREICNGRIKAMSRGTGTADELDQMMVDLEHSYARIKQMQDLLEEEEKKELRDFNEERFATFKTTLAEDFPARATTWAGALATNNLYYWDALAPEKYLGIKVREKQREKLINQAREVLAAQQRRATELESKLITAATGILAIQSDILKLSLDEANETLNKAQELFFRSYGPDYCYTSYPEGPRRDFCLCMLFKGTWANTLLGMLITDETQNRQNAFIAARMSQEAMAADPRAFTNEVRLAGKGSATPVVPSVTSTTAAQEEVALQYAAQRACEEWYRGRLEYYGKIHGIYGRAMTEDEEDRAVLGISPRSAVTADVLSASWRKLDWPRALWVSYYRDCVRQKLEDAYRRASAAQKQPLSFEELLMGYKK